VTSRLEGHLGYWLRYVSNHVSHAFSRKVQARGVTVAEWVVLRELFAVGETAPSQIAARIGLTRGAISKLVDRLEAKALIVRLHATGDRRFQSLTLSKAGRGLVPQLARLADTNDAEFFGHLSASRRKSLEATLREIVSRHGLKALPVE
jgi:DNA-binding MarR family transcriptional regulator